MRRFLVDTRVWLWLQAEPDRLDDRARALMANTDNELLLSAASGLEIAIKHRLGKLRLPRPPAEYVPDRMRSSATVGLPIEHAHALRVAELPDHHRDPFDRLLVAQAQILRIPIVTVDDALAAYDVELIRAG